MCIKQACCRGSALRCSQPKADTAAATPPKHRPVQGEEGEEGSGVFVGRETYRKYSKLAAARAAAAAAARRAAGGGSESDGECVLSAEQRHAPHAAADMEFEAMLEESLLQGEEGAEPAEAEQRAAAGRGGGQKPAGRGRKAGPKAAAGGGGAAAAGAAAADGAAASASAPAGAAPPKTVAEAALASALEKLGEPSWEAFSEKLLQQGMAGCFERGTGD